MKNIFLLPTDKPSRLHYSKVESGEGITYKLILNQESSKCNDGLLSGQRNIYITSSEEIKEGDYILIHGHYQYGKHVTKVRKITGTYEVIEGGNHSKKVCQKTILTTDSKLIADGVQSIDEEFLQWFVKNPSCEDVKIESWQTKGEWDLDYKIIIPKEEPKLELPKLGTDEFNSMCGLLFSGNPKKTNETGNPLTFWGGIDFSNPNADKISSASTITKEHFKQELFSNGQRVYLKEDNNVSQVVDDNTKDWSSWESLSKQETIEKTPKELEPVIAKITYLGELGKSEWYEVVFYANNKWCSYSGSKTFEDGEQVVKWKYCKNVLN